MLPATVPGAASSQVAPAEAARIAAVLRAALSSATIVAYTLRLEESVPPRKSRLGPHAQVAVRRCRPRSLLSHRKRQYQVAPYRTTMMGRDWT